MEEIIDIYCESELSELLSARPEIRAGVLHGINGPKQQQQPRVENQFY